MVAKKKTSSTGTQTIIGYPFITNKSDVEKNVMTYNNHQPGEALQRVIKL